MVRCRVMHTATLLSCLGLAGCLADSAWRASVPAIEDPALPAGLAKPTHDGVLGGSAVAELPEHWQSTAVVRVVGVGVEPDDPSPLRRPVRRDARVIPASATVAEAEPGTDAQRRPLPLPALGATAPPRLPAASAPVSSTGKEVVDLEFDPDLAASLPVGATGEVLPLDLASALGMAAGRNPQVGAAQQRLRAAWANQQAAEVLWLPNLHLGLNWYKHEGRLQDVRGPVEDISRAGFGNGIGAGAVGAGNPAFPGIGMEFALTDALHQPRIAASRTRAEDRAAQAVRNDVMRDTALAYLRLLEAVQNRAIATKTLDHAESLAELTESFARSGEGLQADADRAATEATLRRNDVLRADEEIAVASARLAQLLRVDPTTPVLPQETTVIPLELVAAGSSRRDLVVQALASRPELDRNEALLHAALEALQRERHAPLLPSFVVGMSYGGFGGSDGGNISDYGDRFDLAATAVWQVRQLGFGEKARRERASAEVEQARQQKLQTMDQIAREVVEAHARVRARGAQIETARAGIEHAEASYRRNLDRIREGQGLPIEVQQSVQALDQARREYVRVLVNYDVAQFQLQHALGWPTPNDRTCATTCTSANSTTREATGK